VTEAVSRQLSTTEALERAQRILEANDDRATGRVDAPMVTPSQADRALAMLDGSGGSSAQLTPVTAGPWAIIAGTLVLIPAPLVFWSQGELNLPTACALSAALLVLLSWPAQYAVRRLIWLRRFRSRLKHGDAAASAEER
jgi:hypothetical protein